MKAIKGLVLFCFLGLGISSCFDPPNFSDAPEISFNRIEFKVTTDPVQADTLALYVDFRDGNGNLGLNPESPDDASDPFHNYNFFQENSGNSVQAVTTFAAQVNAPPYPEQINVLISNGNTGMIVTHRTRSKPGFGFLPSLSAAPLSLPPNCRNYVFDYLLIPPDLSASIDSTYNIVDTLRNQDLEPYILIQDTLYFQTNPNYFNIRIRFYEKVGNAFQEFSWEDELCTTFNGRFPVLSDGDRPLDGTIRYNMISNGFIPLFSIKELMLDVIVNDRSLLSDSIRTPPFTLDRIRVN